MTNERSLHELSFPQEFIYRHIGPDTQQTQSMLATLGVDSIAELIDKTVPASIRAETTIDLANPINEASALAELRALANKNQVYKTYLGQGYHDTHVPNVILRNVLENPGWYTAYTPYQPEIAQGRLEGLLNFQQMVIELTGMELANASMLDEATAAAEAMSMAKRVTRSNKSNAFFVDKLAHPQTIAVLTTRAEHFGFDLIFGDVNKELANHNYFGAFIQYPNTLGGLPELNTLSETIHEKKALMIVGADILSLIMLESPGKFGADIVIGSNQRFGIPMGFGGPHAAFFAFKDQHKRSTPGRIIGVSVDSRGKQALRMAMQTREQHIRREKANSNICTSQVLLAVMSAFYAMYHGNDGVTRIAQRVNLLTKILAEGLVLQGFKLRYHQYFDTLCVEVDDQQHAVYERALKNNINVRKIGQSAIGISINECTLQADIEALIAVFSGGSFSHVFSSLEEKAQHVQSIPAELKKQSPALQHQIFSLYHSETDMLRYLKRLESKDIALNHAMIPLGSCTMKLNATAEMIPVSWPEFGKLHPFAPIEQASGYSEIFTQLETMLQACTGYDAISLQPNAGSQGEYAGLVAIKKYFESRDETQRDIV